ncbi:uncharacterized protein LOC131893558 [Tigriopus californicus]|nr:uncharacterized protein LOC131893558 [Tigriopus californicus]
MDKPLDKSTDNINSNASQTLTNHLLGIKIEYKCKDGFFYEDDQSTEKYATCDRTKGNFIYPEPFGKCVESKTCSQKPPGTETLADSGSLGDSVTGTLGAVFTETFSNDYDSSKTYNNDDIVTYKCKSELDEVFKGTERVGEIKNTCQWDETWSLTDENLKDYECKLNLCDIRQLKEQEANAGTLTLETQTHVSFNENGIFKCPEGQLREDDPTTAEFQVLCESTGNFKLPASWPTCADASDLVIDFSTIR